jgi:hypothetical protein
MLDDFWGKKEKMKRPWPDKKEALANIVTAA